MNFAWQAFPNLVFVEVRYKHLDEQNRQSLRAVHSAAGTRTHFQFSTCFASNADSIKNPTRAPERQPPAQRSQSRALTLRWKAFFFDGPSLFRATEAERQLAGGSQTPLLPFPFTRINPRRITTPSWSTLCSSSPIYATSPSYSPSSCQSPHHSCGNIL